ncbi:unnamed protein product, partial [Symbiodinium necroappetens]
MDQGERFIQAITGEKRSIPTWSGQPATFRSWLKLLAVWESETTLARDRWGLRLFQSFPESSQPRKIADQIPMQDLLSERGYGYILTQLMAKYKPFLDIAAPAAIDRFLFTGERGKGESFATFIANKEVARQELELHLQERLSEKVAGRILLRQSNLSDFQREMLALKDQAQLLTFDQVASLLRPLDRPELLAQAAGSELGPQGAKHFPVLQNAQEDPQDEFVEDEEPVDEEESEESWGEDDLVFEDREYDEEEALFISAYHSAYADIRKDLRDRKKVVRAKVVGFVAEIEVFAGSSTTSLSAGSARPSSSVALADRLSIFAGVRVQGGQALVDTAAEDAVVGSKALQLLSAELATFGLRFVPVSLQQAIPCAGIGGSATVTQLVDMPTCVAGILGVVRFSVVEDSESFSTPPLLPISYLEAIRALIDLSNNVLATPDGHRTPMVRLPSGHRAVNILDFNQSLSVTGGLGQHDLGGCDWCEWCNIEWCNIGLGDFGEFGADGFREYDIAIGFQPNFSLQFAYVVEYDVTVGFQNFSVQFAYVVEYDITVGFQNFSVQFACAVEYDITVGFQNFSVQFESIESMQGAEELAKTLGISRDFSYEAMQSVLDRLPTKMENNREVTMRAKSPTATSWVFGLYVRGNMTGVTRAAVLLPEVTKYGNLWMADRFPGQEWSSWTANINMVAKVHIDTHNHKQAPNHTVSFGRFAKGELWLEVDDARVDGVRWKQKDSDTDVDVKSMEECEHQLEHVLEKMPKSSVFAEGKLLERMIGKLQIWLARWRPQPSTPTQVHGVLAQTSGNDGGKGGCGGGADAPSTPDGGSQVRDGLE